ncbi:MAG: hypothetical protein Q8K61_08760 [Gallionella sp.]|nr:hypothetical protein [Gallionella sp.]
MIKLKIVSIFVSASLLSSSLMAEEFIHDGSPCLHNVCVGDDIAKLSALKWEPATFMGVGIKAGIGPTNTKLNKGDAEQLISQFSTSLFPSKTGTPELRSILPYLRDHSFDNTAIEKLRKAPGFCRQIQIPLYGNLISENGKITKVTINVIPGSDSATQAFRVTQIERKVPTVNATSKQISEVQNEIESRYIGINEQLYTAMTEISAGYFTLTLSQFPQTGDDVMRTNNKLMGYPGCTKSLNID